MIVTEFSGYVTQTHLPSCTQHLLHQKTYLHTFSIVMDGEKPVKSPCRTNYNAVIATGLDTKKKDHSIAK